MRARHGDFRWVVGAIAALALVACSGDGGTTGEQNLLAGGTGDGIGGLAQMGGPAAAFTATEATVVRYRSERVIA